MTATRSRRTLLARSVAGAVLALTAAGLTACSSSDEPADTPTTSAPVSDSPFAAEISGPDSASPGDEVTLTVTNTGRLPDAFQLSLEPASNGALSDQDFTLSPDESMDVTLTVADPPVDVVVKSVGGGNGEEVTRLEVGRP